MIEENGKETSVANDPEKTVMVAFYTDVKHRVNVVLKGERTCLQYDLYRKNVDEKDKKHFRNFEDSKSTSNYYKADCKVSRLVPGC